MWAERAGSVRRVPATDVEALVIRSVREHLKPSQTIDDRSLINTQVARVEVQPGQGAGGSVERFLISAMRRFESSRPSQPASPGSRISALFGNLRHFRGLAAVPSVSLVRHGTNFAPKSQIFVKVSGRKLAISEFLAWRLGSNYRRPVRDLIYQLETPVRC
jgi:hypothetical protein